MNHSSFYLQIIKYLFDNIFRSDQCYYLYKFKFCVVQIIAYMVQFFFNITIDQGLDIYMSNIHILYRGDCLLIITFVSFNIYKYDYNDRNNNLYKSYQKNKQRTNNIILLDIAHILFLLHTLHMQLKNIFYSNICVTLSTSYDWFMLYATHSGEDRGNPVVGHYVSINSSAYHSLPNSGCIVFYQSKDKKILNISFPRVGIDLITGDYSRTLRYYCRQVSSVCFM